MSNLINRKEAAKMLCVSQRTVATWTLSGLLPYVRLGNKTIRYSPQAIADFVERSTQAMPTVAQMCEPSLN